MCVVGGRSSRCIRGRQSKTGAPAEGPTVIGVLKTWELVQSRAVFLEKLGAFERRVRVPHALGELRMSVPAFLGVRF